MNSTRLSVLALLAVLLLAGCRDRAGDGGSAAAEHPVPGGTLVIAGPNDLGQLNYLVSGERWAQEVARHLLFVTLVRYSPELEYEPYLARSWELLEDTAVVFRLRDDVFWHDGVKTTAYDVAFTFERAKDPATQFPEPYYFEYWRDVEVVDSFTVRFRIDPHADPLAGWAFLPPLPRHLLEGIRPAELRQARFNQEPVGNGPYRFVEYRPNERWVFEANPDFPEGLGGRPYIDRVVWRVIRENSAQLVELETGAVDLALNVPAERFAAYRDRPGFQGIVRPSRTYAFIGWNGKRAPFDDARVRRALSMAIHREEILEVLRGGFGQLAVGPIGPYHWAFDRSLEPLPYDTARARSLLAEAGYLDRDGDGVLEDAAGRPFSFTLKIPAASEFNRDMAVMIQADLAAVGVEMEVLPTEFPVLVGDISSPDRNFDAALLGWQADFRINLRDTFHSSRIRGPYQMASYSNAEVDRILSETSVMLDRSAATPLWHQLQAIVREEQPWTFLYYYPDLFLANGRVRGVNMDIRGVLADLPRWWLEGGGRPATEDGAARGGEAPGVAEEAGAAPPE